MRLRALLFTVTVALVGCEKEKKPSTDSEEADAGAVDKTAQLDPSLAKAVAAASARSPAAQVQGGPPPAGIFAPGQADKEIKQGEPPKLTLGSQGEEPRYSLIGSSFRPGDKVKGTIQVAVQTDPRQGALPVDFSLSFQAKPATSGEAGSSQVVATVGSASISAAGLPPELATELAALKGSRVEYQVAPNGAGANFTPVPAKGADAERPERWLRALNDALATITLPYPDKPIGAGGFWMATSREGVMGLDLVSYRLIRVQRAEPTQMTLTIETKRYAAGSEFNLKGLPEQYTLQEFQSVAEGTAMLAHGQPLPHKSVLQLNLMALLQPKSKPDERGTLAVQGQARFTFDELQDPAGKPVTDVPASQGAAAQPQRQPAAAQPQRQPPAAQPQQQPAAAQPQQQPPAAPAPPQPREAQ